MSTLILAGAGYSREDLKAGLSEGEVLGGKAVFNLPGLAWEIIRLSQASPPEPASRQLRQDYFRLILDHPALAPRFPELQSLRRQPGFWLRLDRAVEAARATAAHEQERAAQIERLGMTDLRREILALAGLWSDWLGDGCRQDDLGALIQASQILGAHGCPSWLQGATVRHFEGAGTEALEQHFLEELSRIVLIERVTCEPRPDERRQVTHEVWHTIEDAAESLGDRLCAKLAEGVTPSQIVVLIPDTDPSVRFALSRVLQERNVPELDPRDPLEVRLSEDIKRLTVGLDLAVSGFERVRLLEWLSGRTNQQERIHQRLSEMGARQGWRGIEGLLDRATAAMLRQMEDFSRRSVDRGASFVEFRDFQMGLLDPDLPKRLSDWLIRIFEAFEADLKVLGIIEQKCSAREWAERLKLRLMQTPLPPRPVRPHTGIRVVRLSQFNPAQARETFHLFVLGCPAQWLAQAQAGDFYLRRAERDALGTDFAVRSSRSVRASRLAAFVSWIDGAGSCCWLDHRYEMDGSERENPAPLFEELRIEGAAVEMGAHPRNVAGYALVREARGREVRLDPIAGELVELTATDLENISRCSFMGTVFARWRARSPDDPDLDLWPTTSGVLLHAAVEILVRHLEHDASEVRRAPEACSLRAFQEAWKKLEQDGKLRGWVRSPQLAIQIERRLTGMLVAFLEREFEYRDRSGARLLASEDEASFRWEFDHEGRRFAIRGKADRLDLVEQGASGPGLWVIDYKSGTQDLKGSDIRERGYRLQLPFYAVAAQQHFKKPVLGVQLVELTRSARRTVGLFPKSHNGKTPGSVTHVRSNNSSLFDGEPDALWVELEGKIRSVAAGFSSGRADALPVMGAKECIRCRARVVCGQPRRDWVEGAEP